MTYKKELRKKAFSKSDTQDRKTFHDCLKAIRELKKVKKLLHWKFYKKVINGSLNTPEQQVGFPNIPVDPTSGQNYTPFYTDPIRPKDIREVLKSNLNSSPGPDGISYNRLFKFDCLHHILATLYNKILTSGHPSWSESTKKALLEFLVILE